MLKISALLLIVCVTSSILWVELTGSVIKFGHFKKYESELPRDKEENSKEETQDTIKSRKISAETKPAQGTTNKPFRKQIKNKVHDLIATKHLNKNKSKKLNGSQNNSNSNISLYQHGESKSENLKKLISETRTANLYSKQLQFNDGMKSNSGTSKGMDVTTDIPYKGLCINLLVGNNITIEKYLLMPPQNQTKVNHLESNDIREMEDLLELNSFNRNPNSLTETKIIKESNYYPSIKNKLKQMMADRDKNKVKEIPTSTEGREATTVPEGLSSSTNKSNSSTNSSNTKNLTSLATSDNSSIVGNYSEFNRNKLMFEFQFTTPGSHYDDVDASGIEIGYPITFFPPPNCSGIFVGSDGDGDWTTKASTNNHAIPNIDLSNGTTQSSKTSTEISTSTVSVETTPIPAVHYDDVDPSGVEIGFPITFFPPENCNKPYQGVKSNLTEN